MGLFKTVFDFSLVAATSVRLTGFAVTGFTAACFEVSDAFFKPAFATVDLGEAMFEATLTLGINAFFCFCCGTSFLETDFDGTDLGTFAGLPALLGACVDGFFCGFLAETARTAIVLLSTVRTADLLAEFLGIASFLTLVDLVFEGFLGLSDDFPADFGMDLPADLPELPMEGGCFFTLVGLFFEVFNGNSVCHGVESTVHGKAASRHNCE